MAASLPLPITPAGAPAPPVPDSGQPEGPLDGMWARVLDALSADATITRASFATWLKGTRLVAREGRRFTVAAQHGFARDKLDRTFRAAIERALTEQAGIADPDVEFIVPGFTRPTYTRMAMQPLSPAVPPGTGGSDRLPSGSAGVPARSNAKAGETPALPGGGPQSLLETPQTSQAHPAKAPPLNPRYTFASFVAGKETQLALAAARSVADNPVLAYNPLFLHGGAGVGKTHLLHAVGHALAATHPGWRIVLLSCRRLVDELEGAASRGERAAVVGAYAAADALLLDDVQELDGHAAQKEALHLLDSFIAAGKQVVAAADRSPRAMAGLDERLRSCLQMGLVADLAPPSRETRLAILRSKLEARGARAAVLPAGALEQIAQRVTGGVRELEGALARVLAAGEFSRGPLTADGVTAALSGVIAGGGSGPRVRPTPRHVLQAVSAVFDIPEAALLAKRRDREVVLPRQVAMYVMRQETGASLSEIGAALGGRDHTTVMHGCEKVAGAAAGDERLRSHIEAVRHHVMTYAAAAAAQLDSA